MDADHVIRALGLAPHPEGGHFREIHRDPDPAGGRGVATSIYFLLKAGEVSAWHRVDATEIWHFHAGAPLALSLAAAEAEPETHHLGLDFAAGHRPQMVVPAGWWQAAESLGAWTLVGCTVVPAFRFDGFELAPPGWRPGTPNR